MSNVFHTLAASGKMGRMYAERLLKDMTPANFARKPVFAGHTIDCNHPAFVYGHLSIYPQRVLTLLGEDPAPAAVPASYNDLFKNGAECKDDPAGSIYPPMKELTEAFFRTMDAALAAMNRADPALADKPLPEGSFFPLVGPAISFYTNSHVQMHLGQISTWRRCVGLGAA